MATAVLLFAVLAGRASASGGIGYYYRIDHRIGDPWIASVKRTAVRSGDQARCYYVYQGRAIACAFGKPEAAHPFGGEWLTHETRCTYSVYRVRLRPLRVVDKKIYRGFC